MKFLIDTHCHFYPQFDPDTWLAATLANFGNLKKQNRLSEYDLTYGVVLTERSSEDYFSQWKNTSPFRNTRDCSLRPTESGTLEISQPNHPMLTVYPGRQILTAEKLEILCVSNRVEIPDGLSIQETIEEILRLEEIPVIPWSFGKWLGRRRETVFTMLKLFDERLYIGDISHRPSIEPLEKIAAQFNKNILSGSDPLPNIQGSYQAGSFGSLISLSTSLSKPGIRSILHESIDIQAVTHRRLSLASILFQQGKYQLQRKFAL